MNQELGMLGHDIDATTASNARLDIEVTKHQEELESSVSSLNTAEAIRKNDADKFSEDEQSHIQSIDQLDNAMDALNKNRFPKLELGSIRSAMAKRLFGTDAESSLLQLKGQLRGANSPDMIYGVIKQMKTTFNTDLQDMQRDESVSKERHEGLVSAKTEEIAALRNHVLQKKQRLAAGKVAIGYKNENKE